MVTGSLRPMPSTATVSCLIGRVSDRATITASTAAHSIAISPTCRVVFLIASAGAMKTAFGIVSITAIHCLPASRTGANATPPGRPASSGTILLQLCVLPRAGASDGKSACQFAGLPSCMPNSRVLSG
jgi:hypothetical protein